MVGKAEGPKTPRLQPSEELSAERQWKKAKPSREVGIFGRTVKGSAPRIRRALDRAKKIRSATEEATPNKIKIAAERIRQIREDWVREEVSPEVIEEGGPEVEALKQHIATIDPLKGNLEAQAQYNELMAKQLQAHPERQEVSKTLVGRAVAVKKGAPRMPTPGPQGVAPPAEGDKTPKQGPGGAAPAA